jgi:hypothetical protein
MPELKYPSWQEPYQQAMLELDPVKLRRKVLKAEGAILRRLQELSDGEARVDGAREEKLVINDAISALRVLRKEKLRFPERKP